MLTHSLLSSLTLAFLSFRDGFFSCGSSTLRSLVFAWFLPCLFSAQCSRLRGFHPAGRDRTGQGQRRVGLEEKVSVGFSAAPRRDGHSGTKAFSCKSVK